MSEHHRKIQATVRELEDELHQLESVDDETRRLLKEALQEILAALEPEATLERESLMDRLRETAREFEGSHPTLSGIVMRLVDGLGQMGI
jgi:phosphoglycolate phosphatase-like HAD superfamily hydrolase